MHDVCMCSACILTVAFIKRMFHCIVLYCTVLYCVAEDNSSSGPVIQTSGTMIWGAVALSLIVAATAFGNILLCVAVLTEERLQNMTNYFLASLAVADLLVAVVVMPLAVIVQIYGRPMSELIPLHSGV